MLAYHRVLLADTTRTIAFRDAIRQVVKESDVVIDLGSGSGALAFFAAEAGARKVYAIEQQHIADVAAFMARHLGFADRIAVVHDRSTKVELPERATVLVTEMLDAFGLEALILSLTIDARARLLTPGATIIPHRVVLSAVPVELPHDYDTVAWWSTERYGFDLSPLRTFASNTMFTTSIAASAYLASPADLIDIDLATVDDPTVAGSASFEIARDGTLHGFGGWFTATLAEGITLTSQEPDATHWQQAFLPLEQPIPVIRGTRVELELQSHDGQAWRWRGRAGDAAFDQTTWLSRPPCVK